MKSSQMAPKLYWLDCREWSLGIERRVKYNTNIKTDKEINDYGSKWYRVKVYSSLKFEEKYKIC